MNNINNSSKTGTTNPIPTQSLLEVAAANGSFTKFGQAIEKAGLTATLRGEGPFTVFAPTDKAFDQLPSGKLDSLFQPDNKDELAQILNYHIVEGRKNLSDVRKWQTARTVNGQGAPIMMAGDEVRIDGAKVSLADLASKNGVIHGIDKVIMPNAASTTAKPAVSAARA